MKTYVIDTSAIIERIASKLIKDHQIGKNIIIPNAVVAELENQANKGLEIGMIGLEELQELQKLRKEKRINLTFSGERPSPDQIKLARSGEIDAMIRELAFRESAILITADKVQAASAKAFGLETHFIEPKKPKELIEIEKFFDSATMSVHLKENCYPYAKKGKPGNWKLVKINNQKLDTLKIQEIAKEIVEKSRIDINSFIEISHRASTIIQYKNHRIVIVKPPVSNGWEITAVKPLKKLPINYYKLPSEIFNRIKEKAHGIIVAGEPGSGKSTFCQALAEFYIKNKKITKTVESPRDLQLPEEVTQYSKNFASSTEIHDILFLSRPDYIIFDEMRDTPDFKLYIDIRLSGSSVIGVLHSSSPLDAIQRFISRLEIGMIPSIIDTILFIDSGNISKVLSLKITVKVPSGMTEADLARPVVEVYDFQNKKLEYEIYSYGEQTAIVPVTSKKITPSQSLANKQLQLQLKKYSKNAKAELISSNRAIVYIPENEIAKIIGKQGKKIEKIEKKLGIKITVKPLTKEKNKINFNIAETQKYILFKVDPSLRKKSIEIFLENQFLFSAIASNNGEINLHKKSPLGRMLINSLNQNKKIELKI